MSLHAAFQDKSIAHAICMMASLLLLVISGCNRKDSGPPSTGRGRGPAGPPTAVCEIARTDRTRTLQHAGGTTVVPLHPQRIVALNTADAAHFLGIELVAEAGYWEMDHAHYLNPYRQRVGRIGGAYGTRMPVAESVMSYEPDIILIDTFDTPTLEQMKKIAPTVVITSENRDLEQHILDVATSVGEPERARLAVRWLRHKLELTRRDVRAYIQSDPAGPMPIMTVFWPAMKMVRVYDHSLIYEQGLGFTRPAPIRWTGTHFSPSVRVMAPEQLADIDAEYVLCMGQTGGRTAPGRSEALEQNPLWPLVPAVQHGHVVTGALALWTSHGPLAMSLCLNELTDHLLPEARRSSELTHMLKDRPSADDLAEVARWPATWGATQLSTGPTTSAPTGRNGGPGMRPTGPRPGAGRPDERGLNGRRGGRDQ